MMKWGRVQGVGELDLDLSRCSAKYVDGRQLVDCLGLRLTLLQKHLDHERWCLYKNALHHGRSGDMIFAYAMVNGEPSNLMTADVSGGQRYLPDWLIQALIGMHRNLGLNSVSLDEHPVDRDQHLVTLTWYPAAEMAEPLDFIRCRIIPQLRRYLPQ